VREGTVPKYAFRGGEKKEKKKGEGGEKLHLSFRRLGCQKGGGGLGNAPKYGTSGRRREERKKKKKKGKKSKPYHKTILKKEVHVDSTTWGRDLKKRKRERKSCGKNHRRVSDIFPCLLKISHFSELGTDCACVEEGRVGQIERKGSGKESRP